METAASVPSNPRTMEEVFLDYRGRRTAIIRALTSEVDRFYSLCDPGKGNLCLYGYVNESWKVSLPPEEVPSDLPEPSLGINFARDGMKRKDWISMVAVHSDAWLVAVAFFHGSQFNQNERKRLFSMINDLRTVFEVVTEREKGDEETNSENRGTTSKPYRKPMGDGKLKNPELSSTVKEEEEEKTYKNDDERNNDKICGICGKT